MKTNFSSFFALSVLTASALAFTSAAATLSPGPTRGDQMLAEYFKQETAKLSDRCLTDIKSLDDWKARRTEYRQQLFEMLSLSPLPARTDLKPVVTGKIEHELFNVEKLHFQSMPGLYVTANLYVPKKLDKPAPAILYVCGHARLVTNGVSFGNKAGYEHHGSWFARNGYVCLVIDTVQLGEIEGIHHGTHREGMWWWNSRGYSSAGVEAWNSIRALDYLQSRPEVDGNRLGVTGRSGGGAYSWWVTALDDRVKAAAPVAGITDLQNHVVDGVVEGHCDCMFIVNTYRWDYALVAALAAPRPLLICNSDKDSIFPLDGVMRVHTKVAKIYKLYGATNALGLLITEGPHKDTQELQLPVFRWFNRHLKGEEPVIEMAAKRLFQPQDLKVFGKLPSDERTSKIHETFVPTAPAPVVPASGSEWTKQADAWKAALGQQVFRAWPEGTIPLDLRALTMVDAGGLRLQVSEFTSQTGVRLNLYLLQSSTKEKAERVIVNVMNDADWIEWAGMFRSSFSMLLSKQEIDQIFSSANIPMNPRQGNQLPALKDQVQNGRVALAWIAPRGIGPTAWDPNERKQIQIRRRFMLLGSTLDGMRVWDIRRGLQAVRSMEGLRDLPLEVRAKGQMGVNCLYASLFESSVSRLDLKELPKSHRDGPDYLNVLRFLDIPQAAAMAAERTMIHLHQAQDDGWEFPGKVAANLGWEKRFEVSPATRSK
jgi:dienelactone hydrolase